MNTGDQGYTLAWDPVKQKERFRIDNPYEFQGGNLVTAGNLLVYGTMNNTLAIYSADTGAQAVGIAHGVGAGGRPDQLQRERHAVHRGERGLEQRHRARAEQSAPKPFSNGPGEAGGVQAGREGRGTAAGAGALPAMSPPPAAQQPADKVVAGAARVRAVLLHLPRPERQWARAPKDLRFIKPESRAAFTDIVLGGKYKEKGMIPFTGVLTAAAGGRGRSPSSIDRGQQDWQRGGSSHHRRVAATSQTLRS